MHTKPQWSEKHPELPLEYPVLHQPYAHRGVEQYRLLLYSGHERMLRMVATPPDKLSVTWLRRLSFTPFSQRKPVWPQVLGIGSYKLRILESSCSVKPRRIRPVQCHTRPSQCLKKQLLQGRKWRTVSPLVYRPRRPPYSPSSAPWKSPKQQAHSHLPILCVGTHKE